MKDNDFMKDLFKHDQLIPEDLKHKLENYSDRKDRTSYFLDNVIKAGLAVNDKKYFANLLTVMNNSKYDNVKDLAKQIELEYDVDAKCELHNIMICICATMTLKVTLLITCMYVRMYVL